MHRQFSRIKFQKPENLKTLRKDLKNPFQFACRRWMISQ